MCGRYTVFTDKELQEIDDILEQLNDDIQRDKMKTGEICPTDVAPVLLENKNAIAPKLMKWGFPNAVNKGVLINARAETAGEKEMFKGSLKNGRCIIPTTGFYEWDSNKRKYLFNMPGSGVLYLAGLYNAFEGEDRFIILTRAANESMIEIHHRMPVILTKDKMTPWLYDSNTAKDILNATSPRLIKAPADKYTQMEFSI